MAVIRTLFAIPLAVVAGLAIVFIDSSPNFDDTGVTAIGLAIAAFVVVLIEGTGRALRVAMLAVLVGVWIPVLEIAPPGSYGPLLALVFAGVGAVAGMLVIRAVRGGPTADAPTSEGAGG
jgi:hypothetical protein